MSKYARLDALILEACRTSPLTFTSIQGCHPIRLESEALSKVDAHGFKNAYRVVDRRLQALRKAGLIQHLNNRDGWRTVEQKP